MSEITKNLKNLIMINVIVGIGFAFFYLAVPHLYLSLIDWPFFDPYYSWAFGGVFLILSSFLLFTVIKDNKDKFKTVFEIMIAWHIIIIVLNILSLFFIPASLVSIIVTWVYNIVFITLIIFNLRFYDKELKSIEIVVYEKGELNSKHE